MSDSAGKKPVRALLIVDVQNDFINGSLKVPGGEGIIPYLNKLRMKEFDFIYLCLDWHPYNHCSFRSNNPGAHELFQVLYLPSTGDAQVMWPDHCVQGSHGAQLHDDLLVESSDIWTYAGCNPKRDSYSIFKDNGARELTEVAGSLNNNGVTEVYIGGLATDFCVQYTALDAKRFLNNAEIFLMEDCCRGMSHDGVQRAMKSFTFEKIKVIRSDGPEIARIDDRKVDIHNGLEMAIRTPRRIRRRRNSIVSSEVDRLYEAILKNDVDITMDTIQAVVACGLINRECSWAEKTILHACCEKGNLLILDMILLLAEKTLDLCAVTKRGETALMLAVQCSLKPARVVMVRHILNRATPAQAKELLRGQTQEEKMTCLMFACRDGDLDVVEEILKHDSSAYQLHLHSKFKKTALMYACMKPTQEAAAIVELLLNSQPTIKSKLELIKQRDSEDWNCLHFGAKSGCFGMIDWFRCLDGEAGMKRLPLNAKTSSGNGFTMLHLAAFNGKDGVIRAMVEEPCFKENVVVNVPVGSGSGELELDLAVQRHHLECARLLLRLDCHASKYSHMMQELLHRLVLMGDVDACESILNNPDENDITVDESLVVLTQRLENPETCTFSFADFLHEINQFMYRCEICDVNVCLVCKDRCHGPERCRKNFTPTEREHFPDRKWVSLGSMVSHCNCERDKCCARSAMDDARDKGAQTFEPSPLDTSSVYLDGQLLKVVSVLARNMHNLWCQSKMNDGWTFAKTRDDGQKKHNLLKPYDALSEDDNKYNHDMSVESIKIILGLGYVLKHRSSVTNANKVRALGFGGSDEAQDDGLHSNTSSALVKGLGAGGSVVNNDISETTLDQQNHLVPTLLLAKTNGVNRKFAALKDAELSWAMDVPGCRPVDTSNVQLPAELKKLAQRIAQHAHEVWAAEKIRLGYRYCPPKLMRTGLLLSSSLVPYDQLDNGEREALYIQASETLKVIIANGWVISLPKEGSTLRFRRATAKTTIKKNIRLASHNQTKTRQLLFNNYLFSSARRGDIDSLNILLSKRQDMQVGADLNACDPMGHTALYIAIKRGHTQTARRLLGLGVRIDCKDKNGLSPLSLCAYLGNEELCKELVQHNADILCIDKMGFTPLHHAAHQGNLSVCQYLTDRLQQEQQNNDIVNLNAKAVNFTQKESQIVLPEKQPSDLNPEEGSGKHNVRLFRGIARTVIMAKRHHDQFQAKIAPSSREDSFAAMVTPTNEKGGLTEYSPLSLAVHMDRLDIVEMLIKSGANPMLPDGNEGSQDLCSPYIRALMHHIELHDLVSFFRAEIAERALEEGVGVSGSSTTNLRKRMQLNFRRKKNRAVTEANLNRFLTSQEFAIPALQKGGTSKDLSIEDPHPNIMTQWRKIRPLSRRSLAALFSSHFLHNPHNLPNKDIVDSDQPHQHTQNQDIPAGTRRDSHDSAPPTSKLTTRELNKLLDIVVSRYETATKMVAVLNESRRVRSWRNREAIRQFFHEISLLLIMLMIFFFFVQTAPDYPAGNEFVWQSDLQGHFQDSCSNVSQPADLLHWLGEKFIEEDLERKAGIITILEYNYMFGGLEVELEQHFAVSDDFGPKQLTQSYDLSMPSNITKIVLSQGTKREMQAFIVEKMYPLRDGLRRASINMNIYNRFHDLFGIVEISYTRTFSAMDALVVQVQDYSLEKGRFPPSREFQCVLIFCIVMFTADKIRDWFKGRKMRKNTRGQMLAMIMMIGILGIDLYLYETTKELKNSILVNIDDVDFRDMRTVHMLLQLERMCFGFFFFLSTVPLLLASRTIPNIGPVIVALQKTMVDKAVLFFLIVVAASTFLLALTFHVSFSTSVADYGTLSNTFYSLFHTPFIETWDPIQTASQTTVSGLFLTTFYILYSTITLNLLIAVTSDIYPAARRRSDSMWEEIITQGIESKLRDSFSHQGKNKLKSALEIEYWDREDLLKGKDGLKFWTPETGPLFESSSGSVIRPNGTSINSSRLEVDTKTIAKDGEKGAVRSPKFSPKSYEQKLQMMERKIDTLLALLNAPGSTSFGTHSSHTNNYAHIFSQAAQKANSYQPKRNSKTSASHSFDNSSYSNSVMFTEAKSSKDIPTVDNVNVTNDEDDDDDVVVVEEEHKELEDEEEDQQQHTDDDVDEEEEKIDPIMLEREAAKTLIQRLVLDCSEPCPLQKVKEECKTHTEPNLSWTIVKAVRREMGVVQCKEVIHIDDRQQVVRFWRKGTPKELEQLAKNGKYNSSLE